MCNLTTKLESTVEEYALDKALAVMLSFIGQYFIKTVASNFIILNFPRLVRMNIFDFW